jgi:hypothetical protein
MNYRGQCPHNFDFDRSLSNDAAAKAAVVASDMMTARQADAFAAGQPSARVVRIANADHYGRCSKESNDLWRVFRTRAMIHMFFIEIGTSTYMA